MEIYYRPVESDHWIWPRSEQESACLFVQFRFHSESAEPPGTRGCADTQEGTHLGTFYKQPSRPGAGGTGKNGVPTWDSCMPAKQRGGKKNIWSFKCSERFNSIQVIYHFETVNYRK